MTAKEKEETVRGRETVAIARARRIGGTATATATGTGIATVGTGRDTMITEIDGTAAGTTRMGRGAVATMMGIEEVRFPPETSLPANSTTDKSSRTPSPIRLTTNPLPQPPQRRSSGSNDTVSPHALQAG